jgi:4-hydroxy-tetrahydrodipicolinate synthase
MSLRETLRGTGVALVTPFNSRGAIDFNALGRVIDFVIDGGVEYLVSLGTTGETPTLTKREKTDLIQFTYEKARKRVPVIVGIGGNNTAELISDLELFPLEEAVAVLSASPYYNKPSQEGLFQHYKALAEASPKPILLYNVPGRTGRNVSAQITLRLANEVDNIAGIKEASGDMPQCMQILRDKPEEFLVVSGDDALALPQIACGMEGVISVAANCFPRQFSEMVRHSLKGDFVSAKLANDELIEGYDILFTENNPAGVKAFLAEQGLIENYLRLPLTPLSSEVMKRLRDYLSKSKKKTSVVHG